MKRNPNTGQLPLYGIKCNKRRLEFKIYQTNQTLRNIVLTKSGRLNNHQIIQNKVSSSIGLIKSHDGFLNVGFSEQTPSGQNLIIGYSKPGQKNKGVFIGKIMNGFLDRGMLIKENSLSNGEWVNNQPKGYVILIFGLTIYKGHVYQNALNGYGQYIQFDKEKITCKGQFYQSRLSGLGTCKSISWKICGYFNESNINGFGSHLINENSKNQLQVGFIQKTTSLDGQRLTFELTSTNSSLIISLEKGYFKIGDYDEGWKCYYQLDALKVDSKQIILQQLYQCKHISYNIGLGIGSSIFEEYSLEVSTTDIGQIQNYLPHGEGTYEHKPLKLKSKGTYDYGLLLTGCKECKIDQTRFTQQFKNGQLIYEKNKHDNGSIFEGNYKGQSRQGVGKIIFPNESIYIGQVYNGRAKGYGTYYPLLSDSFEGYFQEGKVLSYSVYTSDQTRINKMNFNKIQFVKSITWPCGSQYVGELKENTQIQGTKIGKFFYHLDTHQNNISLQNSKSLLETFIYTGGFRVFDNLDFNGYGILKTKSMTYMGIWTTHKSFKGEVFWFNNDKPSYIGEIQGFKQHGWGKQFSSNGLVYEGRWINGFLVSGNHTNSNKTIYYNGQYRFGYPHGQGVFIWYVAGEYYRKQFISLITEGKRRQNFEQEYNINSQEQDSISTEDQKIYKYQYKGGFLKGQLYGIGTLSSEGVEYQGGFINNIMHGTSIVKYKNQVFIGRRVRGAKQGREQVYYEEIFQEEISFEDGVRRYLEQ